MGGRLRGTWEVKTAPDLLPRPFPGPPGRSMGLALQAWGDVLAGRAPPPHLIVTSHWVSSGRVAVAVDSGGTVVLVSQDGIDPLNRAKAPRKAKISRTEGKGRLVVI